MPPIIVMYTHTRGGIPAEPYGAALTGPTGEAVPIPPGRNGARGALTATGPTPGPPPPWGMQNALCRFRCDTSPPNRPAAPSPTNAPRLAPPTATRPPGPCTRP